MAGSDEKPYLITPPPGLIPPDLIPPRPDAPDTDSATHRMPAAPARKQVDAPPPFFAAPIGAPPPTAPTVAQPSAQPDVLPTPPSIALVLADGSRHPLVRSVLVGRNPAASPQWPDAELLPVADVAKSVSKTHAAFEVEGGMIRVHDLESTNGVRIFGSNADGTVVTPGTPAEVSPGDEIALGDYRVTLT